MFPDEYKEYYDFIIEVVHRAGQMVIRGFEQPKNVEKKGTEAYDCVTDVDKSVEEFLMREIEHRYPHHKIIAEESCSNGGCPVLTDDWTWIIDPVDGTINFINEIPMIAISVALSKNKETVVGIVFNPIINKFYSAVKGGGAYCNGKKITTTKNEDLHKSIIGQELSLASIPLFRERTLARVTKLSEFGVIGFRSFGSAAVSLCYVADGSLGVYFTEGLQCWDVAAGILIVQEAGGCAINSNEREYNLSSDFLLAAGNEALQSQMVTIFGDCDKTANFVK